MAYFDCTIGSAGELSIPLVVTCTANFAGQTITCSDGTTTLTGTCPSASPYEVEFELPNTGTWTVSGTIIGHTYSDSVLVNEFDAELIDNIDIAVDVYSAANDTVSYTGIDNQTHTITTDSNGHASATISIIPNGSSLTFTSSVAKDPDNLSNYYSKTILLTSGTTDIYVMPNKNTLYWWGYKSSDLEDCTSANGWSLQWTSTLYAPTHNTNDIYLNSLGSQYAMSAVGTKTSKSNIDHCYMIAKGISKASGAGVGSDYGALVAQDSKRFKEQGGGILKYSAINSNVNMEKLDINTSSLSNFYVTERSYYCSTNLYALWYE